MRTKIIYLLLILFVLFHIKDSDAKEEVSEETASENIESDHGLKHIVENVKWENNRKFVDLLDVANMNDSTMDWTPFSRQSKSDGITIWAVINTKKICYRIDIPLNDEQKCKVTFYWPEAKSAKLISRKTVSADIKFIEKVLKEPLEFRRMFDEDFVEGPGLSSTFIIQKIDGGEYLWAVRPDCHSLSTKGDGVTMFKILSKFIRLSGSPKLKPARF